MSGLMAERRGEAIALRQEGLMYREIAKQLGISLSYAQQLVTDPTGEETLRRKTQGKCIDCGTEIRSDAPSTNVGLRCKQCQRQWQRDNKRWTGQAIIAAIQRWAKLYGKQPRAAEWNSAIDADERYRGGDWPAWNTVAGVFGTWNKAIEAAGFEPYRLGGHPRIPNTPEELAETAALVERIGLEAASRELGLTQAGVRLRVQKHEGRDMAKPLTAQAVIDREVKKTDVRMERLRKDIKALEQQKGDLMKAKALLNGKA